MTSEATLQKVGAEILTSLQEFNRRAWDALSFKLAYDAVPKIAGVAKKVSEYRKTRWELALKKASGNKARAYELLSSEDFY